MSKQGLDRKIKTIQVTYRTLRSGAAAIAMKAPNITLIENLVSFLCVYTETGLLKDGSPAV